MRRRYLGVVLVVALLGVGLAPANAGEAPPWPLNCAEDMPSRPAQGTVYVDEEGLHADLGALDGDLSALAAYAGAMGAHWRACIAAGAPTEPVACLAAVVSNLGAYFEVEGTQVHVYYPALIQALAACP